MLKDLMEQMCLSVTQLNDYVAGLFQRDEALNGLLIAELCIRDSYYGEPLHLALVHLGAGHDDAVSCLFYGMGKSMEKDPRLSPRQAAEQELNAPNYASLTAMDREILLEIFEGMGRDQQGQKSALSPVSYTHLGNCSRYFKSGRNGRGDHLSYCG